MEVDKTIGAITWMDLTVPGAQEVKDFYANVVGWKTIDVAMGEYDDYCMMSPADEVVRTGICHAKGPNASMPSQWVMYINVSDLEESIRQVEAGGGEVVNGPRMMGSSGRYCIIKDPVGAFVGLFQHLTFGPSRSSNDLP